MGCDTFVVLSTHSKNGSVIFGKNSDRPQGEVQEVIYVPGSKENYPEELQVTYIKIPNAPSRPVILSKPAWMWGAEMGANNAGVAIGNEAVFTKLQSKRDFDEKLLGMDLVRLGLERGNSAAHALEVITELLEKYGQGGRCSDTDPDLIYHNSFLIADSSEVWVLETAGRLWAAEKITEGYRNISNVLTIGTKIDRMSKNLKEYCKEKKIWNGIDEFHFSNVLTSEGDCLRYKSGQKLLQQKCAGKKFTRQNMMEILRDKPSGISRPYDHPFHTSGSQVSVLTKYANRFNSHWFTATPDPNISVFKPFIFSSLNLPLKETTSPKFEKDPAKIIPRFTFQVNRAHLLYQHHREAYKNKKMTPKLVADLRKLENDTMSNFDKVLLIYGGNNEPTLVNRLFLDCAEKEIKLYS